MFAAHLRNDAERAGVITTFGNFYIGEMFGGEAPARGVEVGDVDGKMVGHEIIRGGTEGASQDSANDGGNLLQLVESDEGVDFRKFPGEFGGEALRHAAGDNQALIGMAPVQAAVAVGFENGSDALGFGGVDKGAGVDDENIGLGGVGSEIHPSGAEVAEHDFRVDQIFGAA